MRFLVLTCKSCGQEFTTRFDASWEISLVDQPERCPHCGEVNTYNSPDYRAGADERRGSDRRRP